MLNAYPFDAVLFDLDGVIIDTTELHYSVWREFAEARGIACSREMLLATNGRKASETICLWLNKALPEAGRRVLCVPERDVAGDCRANRRPSSSTGGTEGERRHSRNRRRGAMLPC